jgi:hypothetical protein
MLHKPKTVEDVAHKWAKTPEQEKRLSEAIASALSAHRWAQEILKNELSPRKARKSLEQLFAALHNVKVLLGRPPAINSAVNALLRQEHLKLQKHLCRVSEEANKEWEEDATKRQEAACKQWEDANKHWGEIEKRFWNDIEGISRLRLLAAAALDEQKDPIKTQEVTASTKRAASINKGLQIEGKRPWLIRLGADAETMWHEVLGRAKRGEGFLDFYNDLCDLAGEKPVPADSPDPMNTLNKRRRRHVNP